MKKGLKLSISTTATARYNKVALVALMKKGLKRVLALPPVRLLLLVALVALMKKGLKRLNTSIGISCRGMLHWLP